jgi:hypothetical protein
MEPIFAAFGADMWTELIANFGPLVGIVLFFIWRDWRREDALTKRVEKLEDYQRDTLVNLVERSTTALAQNAECLSWVARVMERLCSRCPFVEANEAPQRVKDVERR